MREVLENLTELAKELNIAIVCVMHCRKETSSSVALDLISGSGAIGAVVRNAFYVAKDPNDDTISRFLSAKNNGNEQSPGFYVQCHQKEIAVVDADGNATTDKSAYVDWVGPAYLHADDIIHELQFKGGGSKMQDAIDFYRERLADGPIPADDIKDEASMIASEKTLQRARKKLGIRFDKSDQMYSLPDSSRLNIVPSDKQF